MFYCFCFLFSGALRDLYSFPTRRSSDLVSWFWRNTTALSDGMSPHADCENWLPDGPLGLSCEMCCPLRPRNLSPTPTKVNSVRSEEHTSELQSLRHLVCRLLLEKKNKKH